MMVKKILLSTAITVSLLGLGHLKSASAHLVASDGPIGVILHIEPFDYPVATEPQDLVFYYNDSNEQFSTDACSCRIVITKDGKSYLNKIVPPTSSSVGKISYTFPVVGVYKVSLNGVPKTTAAFKAFSINYNIRVNPDSPRYATVKKTDHSATILLLAFFSLGFLMLLAAAYYSYGNSKKGHKKTK